MKVAAYLKCRNKTVAWLAREIGVQWRTVNEIKEGRSRPLPETAEAIERATDGDVTAAELLGLAAPRRRRTRRAA